MSFLDLRDAFGSVCHQYLFDVLQYLKLPDAILSYVTSCYSQLSAYVSTDNTAVFCIHRRVFLALD